MRIVVMGYIIRGPLGGMCWHYLQYLLGFRQLGHEVLFLEDSDNYPSCYDPVIDDTTNDPSYGILFITNLFKKFDLQHNWAYYDEHSNQWFGLTAKNVESFCKSADLVLNISNVSPLRDWWIHIPQRILLDTDPAFTQVRNLEEPGYRNRTEAHTHFFSFGENFGKKDCLIPDDGFNWKPTRQPVVMNAWSIALPKLDGKWTNVMQWDSYKERNFKGICFGMKSASFKDFFNLPGMVDESFELAVGSRTAPLKELEKAGWKLTNPLAITETTESYQRYIAESKGEFSVAKHGYVVSRSGWFSERSAGYLASGRPVITQNTGFDTIIETGKGLFSFNSVPEIKSAIKEINVNYPEHCRYARELAEEYFNSDKVLSKLLNMASFF